jgi:RNA polymerase sigma-70 factor (ECF subfamily)
MIAVLRLFFIFAPRAPRDQGCAQGRVQGRTRAEESRDNGENGATLSADDAALVARVRTGDREAFTELVTAYSTKLLTLAYSVLGSRAEAEDVVQDVLLRIWTARVSWMPGGSVRAYLATAVRRRAVDVLRRRRVAARNAPLVAAPGDEMPSAFADPDDDARLWAAVAVLDVRWREAITLRYVNQLGYAEVGRALGVSPDAARMTVRRAVEALRAALAG